MPGNLATGDGKLRRYDDSVLIQKKEAEREKTKKKQLDFRTKPYQVQNRKSAKVGKTAKSANLSDVRGYESPLVTS